MSENVLLDAGGTMSAHDKGAGCYLCAFRCRCAEVEDGEMDGWREGDEKKGGVHRTRGLNGGIRARAGLGISP